MIIDIVVPVGMASQLSAPVIFGGIIAAVLPCEPEPGFLIKCNVCRSGGGGGIIRQVIVPSENIRRNR